MQIGKKLFPYPVLNKFKDYSSYKNSKYSLHFTDYQKDDYYIFENTYVEIENDEIKEMIKNDLLGVAMVIECSETVYRQTFEISIEPNTYMVKMSDLKGTVSISCYIYAKKDIESFKNTDLLDDYNGYEFYIEKNDIIAVDEGFTLKIEYNIDLDKKVSSIFQVIRNLNIDHMLIDNKLNKIVISIPDQEFGNYDALRKNENLQNIIFSMLAIPALTYSLKELQDYVIAEKYEFDDIVFSYVWFNSIKNAYLKKYNTELTEEIFKKINVEELAQKLLNNGSLKGINDLFNILIDSNYGGEDDE